MRLYTTCSTRNPRILDAALVARVLPFRSICNRQFAALCYVPRKHSAVRLSTSIQRTKLLEELPRPRGLHYRSRLDGASYTSQCGKSDDHYDKGSNLSIPARNEHHDIRRQLNVDCAPETISSWKALFSKARLNSGLDGTWQAVKHLKDTGNLQILAIAEDDFLRDSAIMSALSCTSRVSDLVEIALWLSREHDFAWPDLYARLMHGLFEKGDFPMANFVHFHAFQALPPGRLAFISLLSSFVTKPTRELQATLTTMYIFSDERNLYDLIIPLLFSAGQSNTARTWRKQFHGVGDVPSHTSQQSQAFLSFLHLYYPEIRLTQPETQVLTAGMTQHVSCNHEDHDLHMEKHSNNRMMSDTFVARLFASAWTSVEFAITLACRLGLRRIGPLSLQSMAIREQDAVDIRTHLNTLEKHGVELMSRKYNKALVSFARRGDDDSLRALLQCDIHPDEFEDNTKRRLFLDQAKRDGNRRLERLFQKFEMVTDGNIGLSSGNSLPSSGKYMARAEVGLVKESSSPSLRTNNLEQDEASKSLDQAFKYLDIHPSNRELDHLQRPSFKRAVRTTREVASQGLAVKVKYWKHLLYVLGRTRRFRDLEQLSLEIVDHYHQRHGGLIPIHEEDLPVARPSKICPAPEDLELDYRMTTLKSSLLGVVSNNNDESLASNNSLLGDLAARPTDTIGELPGEVNQPKPTHIASDMPFVHPQHPVYKIFDTRMQRAIVRWCFDGTLAKAPSVSRPGQENDLGIEGYDVASGVRLLALLRDQGVRIDTLVLEKAVISRIALAQVPGRPRSRLRDSNEFSVGILKELIDKAWGSQILPPLPELEQKLNVSQGKLWKEYPILMSKAYGKPH